MLWRSHITHTENMCPAAERMEIDCIFLISSSSNHSVRSAIGFWREIFMKNKNSERWTLNANHLVWATKGKNPPRRRFFPNSVSHQFEFTWITNKSQIIIDLVFPLNAKCWRLSSIIWFISWFQNFIVNLFDLYLFVLLWNFYFHVNGTCESNILSPSWRMGNAKVFVDLISLQSSCLSHSICFKFHKVKCLRDKDTKNMISEWMNNMRVLRRFHYRCPYIKRETFWNGSKAVRFDVCLHRINKQFSSTHQILISHPIS